MHAQAYRIMNNSGFGFFTHIGTNILVLHRFAHHLISNLLPM